MNSLMLSLRDVVVRAHVFVFKAPPGETTKKFVKNLFYALFGVGGTALVIFVSNILIVRHIGPDEFGKWNIITSVAGFLVLVPTFGMTTTALRYLGAHRDKQKEIIGSIFWTVVFFGILSFAVYIIFANSMQSAFNISGGLYKYALLYAAITIVCSLFQSFFQGIGAFRRLSFFMIVSSLLFAAVVVLYIFVLKDWSFRVFMFSHAVRLFVVTIAGLFLFRRQLFTFCEKKMFIQMLNYGLLNMLSVFAGFFSLGMIDNLMINHYLGSAAVGLYAAYYTVFNVFVGMFLGTFSQVFLPAAAKSGDINALFGRFKILLRKSFAFLLVVTFLLIWLIFKFYGKSFVFDWRLAALMSFSVILYVFLTILGNIMSSTGVRGAKFGLLFAPLSAIINVSLNVLLIPKMQLFGSVIASISATTVIFVLALSVIKSIATQYEKE